MTAGFSVALLVGALALPFGGGAHRKTEEGNQSYLEGEYEEALRAYTEAQVRAPQAAELYYDIGNVLYRQGDYEGAAEAYTRALLEGHDTLESQAAFNLGNARYRLDQYDEAIEGYERALRLSPQDADAKRNLELALRAREEQRKQQQDQQGQEDQKDQKGQQGQGQEGQEGQKDQEQGSGQESQDPSGAGEQQPPQEPQRGGDPESGDKGQAARPGEMSAEEAARLLDGLEEQELDNLRQRLLEKRARRGPGTEKDW